MNFEQSSEFTKELKYFAKKYRSLTNDLAKFQVLIGVAEKLEELHFFEGNKATKLSADVNYEVIKARLDCVDLGNKQLLRIVYIRRLTDNAVIFIELFAKNIKSREDSGRIKQYLRSFIS